MYPVTGVKFIYEYDFLAHMGYKERYINAKHNLISNSETCKENRELFSVFFDYEERKLKRQNNLPSLDENCYRTLYGYVIKFKNINKWFNNKPWKNLTKADIQRVYDDLEDGRIKTRYGTTFKDREGYYNKIFRSKPFELAGKKELVLEVMEFYKKKDKEDVRFINEETFRKLVSVAINPVHKFLFWLAFDIGENINALLQLKRRNLSRQKNPHTGEAEYCINLQKEILKRSRKPRTEITNYKETVEYADIVLEDLKDDEPIFKFRYRQANKIIDRAVKITGTKCIPNNEKVTWKDLRSSMACDLLRKGWTTDEVNARLGHRPSSVEIDKYVNFLALNRHRSKKKLYHNDLDKVQQELEKSKGREKLLEIRMKNLQEEMAELTNNFTKINTFMNLLMKNDPEVVEFLSEKAKEHDVNLN